MLAMGRGRKLDLAKTQRTVWNDVNIPHVVLSGDYSEMYPLTKLIDSDTYSIHISEFLF